MNAIVNALATDHFPASEVAGLIAADNSAPRQLVLAALRAEPDDRLTEGLGHLFESVNWRELADANHGFPPALAMLGAARSESATGHLAAAEVVKLYKVAEQPDAACTKQAPHQANSAAERRPLTSQWRGVTCVPRARLACSDERVTKGSIRWSSKT